ncbi:Sucrose transporter [Zostera marina]|uniref:Sucrose transporter n=2 Tax=Zostera marina TaxID=29655 RepID=A0A0K9P226_ZOSMR|nr:Sucrose transporter [Zostera marina]
MVLEDYQRRPKSDFELLLTASVACGVQFGWALQLSLLTPYVQDLGVPHVFVSLVWLCGPLSGLIVQPLVGHVSDRTTSKLGRRRPFIIGGTIAIALSVFLVSFSADIGGWLGDQVNAHRKSKAIGAFITGFWLLDVGNNVTQGPCRALLADLADKDERRTRVGNGFFSLFMAVGNVLGYATGTYGKWYKLFPFTRTKYCNIDCANLKSAFLIHIVILACTTYLSVSRSHEIPLERQQERLLGGEEEASHQVAGINQTSFSKEFANTLKLMNNPIWIIFLVTALSWFGWFPFILYDTDWMGREVFKGNPNTEDGSGIYAAGVRAGSFGLMLNSIVLGFFSWNMDAICTKLGSGLVWGISSIIMAASFGSMVLISFWAENIEYTNGHPSTGIFVASLIVFAVLGAPLAVTFSVPYALVSIRSEEIGIGQGLSLGLLNLAIVIPQMAIAVLSGPLDVVFGGGNWGSLSIGAVAAFISGIVSIISIHIYGR